MRLRRNAVAVLTAATLMLGAVACGGEDEPSAEPTGTASQSPTPTESPTTAPAWKDDYPPKQLEAYEAALARWESYENRTAPIWAEGKATDRAEALFKQYFPSPFWQSYYRRLQSYEAADVRVEGTPGVFWSKPKSISDNGLSVEIQQCVDYTQGKTTQAGQEADVPGWAKKPNLRTISLSKPKGYDWLIYGVIDASSGKARPCEP